MKLSTFLVTTIAGVAFAYLANSIVGLEKLIPACSWVRHVMFAYAGLGCII